MMRSFITVFSVLFFWNCNPPKPFTAQEIVNKSYSFYGGSLWDNIHLQFQFRKHRYTLFRKANQTVYTRSTIATPTVVDSLFGSGSFRRSEGDQAVALSDSLQSVYSESVNSVLYFFQIPRVLNDAAVVKQRLADIELKGKKYHTLKITFRQQAGGTDFEDEFRYWIDAESFAVDYLAYNYITDGGGIRFRSVSERFEKFGMRFQNYTNYKPLLKDTPLDSLPRLFTRKQLIAVSQINNLQIKKHPL